MRSIVRMGEGNGRKGVGDHAGTKSVSTMASGSHILSQGMWLPNAES